MQIVETLNDGLKRAYTLTVTAKDIDARVDEEVKAIAPQVRMPGFRAGKVPANLVRKMHGASLQREALDKSIRDGIDKLITDNKLRPAMQPTVELTNDYEEGKDAEIKVALEVLPVVPTPNIEGIKLERLIVDVTDEQIDESVNRLAEQGQRFEDAPAKAKAKTGDQVVMDFVGKVGDVAFDGGTGTDMAVVIGSGNLIPGFEDQLVGVKVGEEKTINVTFPKEYQAANLAGKDATFDLSITAVKVASEKAPDDEFAKQFGLESLEKLRELLKSQIEQEHGGLTRTFMKRRLLDQLAAGHDFEVPPGMVEAEFGQIWAQLEHEAGHEEDPEAARAEMEAEKDDYRSIAERRVRLGLLLSEIGQANGVEITQAEMNRLIAQAAQQYSPQDRERFVEYVRNEPMAAAQLRAPLYEDKVVDFLFEKADVSERTVARADLEAAIESEDSDLHVHGPDCGHDHGAKPAKKAAAKKPAAKADDADKAAAEPAEAEKAPAKKAAAKKAPAKAEAAADAEKPAAKKPAAKKKAAPTE
ncbi:MAG TPA: trigger factor [Mycoplana sp.]|nr:trigger factor [Mycoplana sp.]